MRIRAYLKKIFRHPAGLAAQILFIVYFFDFMLMELLSIMRIEFGKHESLVEPFVAAMLALPPLYFGILKPYIEARNKSEAELAHANDEKNKLHEKHMLDLTQQRERIEADFLHTNWALKESEKRYELAAKGSNDGLWDWHAANTHLYLSPRFLSMIGYPIGESLKNLQDWEKLVHPKDIKNFQEAFKSLSTASPYLQCSYRIQHYLGDYIWVLTKGYALFENGEISRIAGSQTDITEQKKAEKELIHNAMHDTLTSLFNRTIFKDRVSQAIARAHRHQSEDFAVVFLDLDNFKNINDIHGHSVGDEVIRAIAKILLKNRRENDTVARLGGDEFALLLEDVNNEEEAHIICERLVRDLHTTLIIENIDLKTSASVGVALYKSYYQSAEDIIKDADLALYAVKRSKRGSYKIYNDEMRKDADKRFFIESELREALKTGKINLHYQPIINLKKNTIAGFEALVRWNHPTLGYVAPIDFITIAEESDLILELGEYVLDKACKNAVKWRKADKKYNDLFISVNVSGRQLESPNIAKTVEKTLKETGLPSKNLKIELTETFLVSNPNRAELILTDLRSLGIRTAIDDFGTGFSSLSALHKYPFDSLKIDRSFITQIDRKQKSKEIVNTIATLAKTLNMKVVAEGIETLDELEVVKKIGCYYGQGYKLSHPLTAEDAFDFLTKFSSNQAVSA